MASALADVLMRAQQGDNGSPLWLQSGEVPTPPAAPYQQGDFRRSGPQMRVAGPLESIMNAFDVHKPWSAGDTFNAAMMAMPGGRFPAYHGTGRVFDKFSMTAPKTTGGGLNDTTISFSPDPRVANRYAEFYPPSDSWSPNVRPVNLDMKKPLGMTSGEFERLQDIANMVRNGKPIPEVKGMFLEDDLAAAGIKWDGKSNPVDAIKKAHYDSLIKQGHRSGAEPEYQVFDPNQITPRYGR